MNHKWVGRFLDLAEHVSTWSKDSSTQVGAVIVRPDKSIVATGYNGFPRGMEDLPSRYQEREYKYKHVIHAEVNAVLSAKASVEGCYIFLTHPPCRSCLGMMKQAGITDIYFPTVEQEWKNRWDFDGLYELALELSINLHEM